MRHDLVSEKVEVDPFFRGASLTTAQQIAIKATRFQEVANGKGEVEAGVRSHFEEFLRAGCERSKAGW